jgi:bifunctional non-homologous end joining protein LigD
MEREITEGLEKGHLAILLHGDKLNGEFVLQKLKQDEKDTAWLLIKKDDAYAEEHSDEEVEAKQKKKR